MAMMMGSRVVLLLLLCLAWRGSSQPPNIVFLLTDDQDLLLGGTTPMAYTKSLLETRGAELTNFFVNTPVCCPSRTTLLSGIFPHNWHTVDGGCMHMNVTTPLFQESSLGVLMKRLNYTTGMFGKYLNPPGMSPYCTAEKEKREKLPGFDSWMAMCNDNKYYENTFSVTNGSVIKSGVAPKDYLTSLIGNASVDFVESSLKSKKPFFVYIAPHAPHVPATPALWYKDRFSGQTAPRTPNYNFSALDHHYVVRSQPVITHLQGIEVDQLFEDRWRTLLSVDDITVEVVKVLEQYGQMDNTYFVWTSDHGFQLGQFRLPSCKLQPYEHDIRVPFHVMGPKITGGTKLSFVAGMVDVAPTFTSLGGGEPTDKMDGKSFASLLRNESPPKTKDQWRDKHMIEYWSLGDVVRYEHYIDLPNNTYIGARLLNATHNYLYVEFYDGENVVDFTNPLEYELFDIGADSYQMKNIYGTKATESLAKELHDFIHQQVKCQGSGCI